MEIHLISWIRKNNKRYQSKVEEGLVDQNQIQLNDKNLKNKINLDKPGVFGKTNFGNQSLPNLLMHEEAQDNRYKIENLNQKLKKVDGGKAVINQNLNDVHFAEQNVKEVDLPQASDSADGDTFLQNKNGKHFTNENSFSLDKKQILPLIESTNPAPFYVGWDDKSRKMVITNRRLFSLNQNIPVLTESFKKELSVYNENQPNLKRKDGRFTAWPIPKSILKNAKKEGLSSSLPYFPYKVLFNLLDTPENSKALENSLMMEMNDLDRIKKEKWKEIPANFQFDPNESSFHKVLSPNRGGFVWPGSNSSLSH